MEDDQSPQGARRQQYQNFRSTSSINWRVKDDNPRQESPQQDRVRRDNNEQGYSSPRGGRGGYGYGRRDNNDYPAREQREIPGKPESPRLYVGNLLYTAQSNDISNFFLDNGFNVVNVSMSIDQVTGRNPSYCFVDLESIEEATRAMEQLNGAELMGRSVRINPGVARKEGQSGAPRRGYGAREGGEPRSGWRERESNGSFENTTPRSSNERWSAPRGENQRSAPADQSKRLYVGGLPPIDPQSAVEAEISTLFSRADPPIEIASVSNLIAPHASKANEPGDHHYLFVDLKSDADTERAIEMFNDADSPWNEGGRLKVNRAREARDRDGRDGGRRGARDGGRGFGRQWRNDPQGE